MDEMTGRHFKMAMGFFRSTDHVYFGMKEGTFGGAGTGGQTFFSDPDNNLAFGYLCNRVSPSVELSDRSRKLIDSTYRCI